MKQVFRPSRSWAITLGYIGFLWIIRLCVLSLVTFSLFRGTSLSERGALEKIGDLVNANLLLIYAASSLAYFGLIELMRPVSRTRFGTVFGMLHARAVVSTQSFQGILLAAVFATAGVLSRNIHYLGFYISISDALLSIVSSLFFAMAFVALALAQEFLLREILHPFARQEGGDHAALLVTSLFSLCFAWVQFRLSFVSVIYLLALNAQLQRVANKHGHFGSAAFVASWNIGLHILFGLPLFSQDMPGLLLLRGASDSTIQQVLSGGVDGPECGVMAMLLILVYLFLPRLRNQATSR